MAKLLGCDLSEIIFTGCGSESNNIALLGLMKMGDHFITSSYEHPAVLKTANELEKNGIDVTYIKPNSSGLIELKDIENSINTKTKLVSIMYVNNELGTENPINQIAELTKKHGILFHTDAVQLIGKKEITLRDTSIDLLSLSAHKFYGPKGVGALYIKHGIDLIPTYFGGGQEKELRPGTENIVSIHGMSIALQKSMEEKDEWNKKVAEYESSFFKKLKKLNINYTINGSNRISGILNITFHDILSQDLVIALDMKGYAISGGSACSSGSAKTSTSLKEIKMDDESASKTVRISFGKNLTTKNILQLSDCISEVINKQYHYRVADVK
jgi:cysteine desulfurase